MRHFRMRSGKYLVGAGHQRGERNTPSIGVEHRHYVADGVAFTDCVPVDEACCEGMQIQGPVRIPDPFR